MNRDVFTSKLITLLLVQQKMISESTLGLDSSSGGWKSLGEVLGSPDYREHVIKNNKVNKREGV